MAQSLHCESQCGSDTWGNDCDSDVEDDIGCGEDDDTGDDDSDDDDDDDDDDGDDDDDSGTCR